MKEKLKKIIYFLLNILSTAARIFFRRPRVTILMYHSVSNNSVLFNVTPADFATQMKYLQKHKYKVISLTKLVAKLANHEELEDKSVILTFDDGYRDNYINAWPILKNYNYPATIFLPTAYLGQLMNNSQNIALEILGSDQIREMSVSGLIEFGSHSHSHPRLEKLSNEDFDNEARQSKEIIEALTARPCKFFSYPKGFYKKEFIDILKNNGFNAAVVVSEGLVSPADNLLLLKRNFIYSAGGSNQFKGKLGYGVLIYNFLKDIFRP